MVKAMLVGAEVQRVWRKEKRNSWMLGSKKYTVPLATSESNDVVRHSFTGLSKKRSNFCRKVNGGSSSDTNGFDSVGNGTICGESLELERAM